MSPDEQYNKLAVEMRQIETELEDIKNKQFIGTDSVQLYKNQTEDAWDYDHTTSFSLPQTEELHSFSVLFTADNQNAPFSKLTIDALIDNTTHYQSGKLGTGQNGVWFNDIFYDYDLYFRRQDDEDFVAQPNQISWYFAYSAYASGKNIKMKLTVHSTDTGVIDIVEIQHDT